MADFEIPENPDFVESVRKFEPTDPAHADLFNRVILALLESLAYLRKYKADMDYVDLSYQQATGYADKIVAALINGAPEMLNTLDKLANAVEENASIIDVLVAAIGKKAEQVELDTHTGNNVIHITSAEHEGLTEAIKHTKTEHVTGVKGSAESIYHTGNVEITAEKVGLGNVDNTADSTKSVNYAASAGNAAKVNGHSVNADVPSDAKFTDTKGTCLSGRSSAYGWSVNHLPSGYLIEAFHTAAQNYTMTNQYGNMYWASFEITIPQSNNIKFFDAINITPFATSGLISVSITNYTTSKIQGFVFSPLAETKSISFHVTLHGTAS